MPSTYIYLILLGITNSLMKSINAFSSTCSTRHHYSTLPPAIQVYGKWSTYVHMYNVQSVPLQCPISCCRSQPHFFRAYWGLLQLVSPPPLASIRQFLMPDCVATGVLIEGVSSIQYPTRNNSKYDIIRQNFLALYNPFSLLITPPSNNKPYRWFLLLGGILVIGYPHNKSKYPNKKNCFRSQNQLNFNIWRN